MTRRERIIGYIKENRTMSEIAQREGIEPYYAGVLRRQIAKEEGLKVTDSVALDKVPYGVDDQSKPFRMRLANMLYDLTKGNGGSPTKGIYTPEQLSYLIGIPERSQHRAREEKKLSHDWTMSQLQRLAKLMGKDFVEFMRELVR